MSAIGEQSILPIEKVKPLIGWFLILTAVFSAPFYYLTIKFGSIGWYIGGLMWMPGAAALVACKVVGVNNDLLGWRWGKNKWIIRSYLIPLGYFTVIYGSAHLFGIVDFLNEKTISWMGDRLGLNDWTITEIALFGIPFMAAFSIFRQTANALGEEIGWRGLLAPQLMRLFSFPVAALISGLIWFAWHLPIILWGGYNTGFENLDTQMINFAIMLTAISFPMLYLRMRSGSLWTGAIFHAAHNLMMLFVFEALFSATETSKFYVGEWGMITAGVTTVIALITWYLAHKNNLIGPVNR